MKNAEISYDKFSGDDLSRDIPTKPLTKLKVFIAKMM